MIHNISNESISDSSDSEEELTSWTRISKRSAVPEPQLSASRNTTIAVPCHTSATASSIASSSSSSPFIKKEKNLLKAVPVIDIEDSSDDSDSDSDSDDSVSSSMSTTQSATSGGALAQLLTINQRQPQTQMQSKPKPQHPNLITRIRPTASSASASSSFSSAAALPPRHPTLERNAGDKDKPTTHSQQQQQQQQRVSPVSGMSSSSHQSAKQKALFLWRRRLWPSLAPFYRILLRCHCKFTPTPSSSTGALADKDQGQEQDTFLEMRQGEMALEWGSFWDPAALAPLSLHFSSVAEHNTQLFLLLLEECRSGMSTQISKQPQGYLSGSSAGSGGGGGTKSQQANPKELKWQRGEVKMITANLRDSLSSLSPSGSGSLKVDPRLGSLWMLQVQLLPPKRARSDSELSTASNSSANNTTDPQQQTQQTYVAAEKSRLSAAPLRESDNNAAATFSRERSNSYNNMGGSDMVEGYRPGELLVCRNQAWGNRLALGVVQGYDPDYDMLLNSSSSSDDCRFTTVHLLVCVDTASSATASGANDGASGDQSGWIKPESMHLCQGTIVQLSVIGNLITSLRECQAISSLASLRPSLRDLILCHPDNKSYRNDYVQQQAASKPEGVSPQLWKSLLMRYNNSQLRAMASVIEVPRATATSSTTTAPATAPAPDLPALPPYPLILLQGPPGTGKTSTIMGIIAILLDAGVPSDSLQQGKKIRVGSSLTGTAAKSIAAKSLKPAEPVAFPAEKTRILLCAPSNTAVDELIFRIKKFGVLGRDGQSKRSLVVVRIGQPLHSTRATSSSTSIEGVAAFVDVKEFTLDYLVDKKRREIESAQRSGYRRPFMPSTLQLRHQVLEQADIVCCTLSGSGSPQLLEAIINHGASDKTPAGGKSNDSSTSSGDGSTTVPPFRFDVVIIDEAAQAVEPSALIPLKYNPKVLIMVGDACQLRATVLSRDSSRLHFGRSLFERLDLAGFPKLMLLTQYRMHPDIAYFPSKRFYDGKLINDSRMLAFRRKGGQGGKGSGKGKGKGSHWKPFHEDRSAQLRPLVFHNVKYGREELSGSSYCNRAEAEYILSLVALLRRQYPSSCPGGVGIITAYNAQKHLLTKLFKQQSGHSMGGGGSGIGVEISTIDGFQGREKDVIIFSCVRSSSRQELSNIGFMNDNQRLNVALTRAKYALWLVGDVNTMQGASGRERTRRGVWGELIDHCRKKGCIYELRK